MAPAATVSVEGDWTLVHRLNPGAGIGANTSVTGSLHLIRSGMTVTGTYTLADPPRTVPVSGTLSGRSLTMQVGPVTLDGGASLSLSDTMEVGDSGASGSMIARATLGPTSLSAPGTCSMTRP